MTSVTVDPAPAPDGTAPASARLARLAAGVSQVRRRGGIDLERVLLIGGSVLLPTGLIVILLGWYGAAHTSYSFEQTPYLISGGLLGAAMTVAGGFLYFGYWLTRLVHEGRRQRTELADLLGRIDERLARIESFGAGAVAPSPSAISTPSSNGTHPAPTLVATATGSLVHRADCPLLRGKAGLRSVDGAAPGMRPCKVCEPDFVGAGARG